MEYIPAQSAGLIEQGRIKGAFRLGWAWAIPKDAEKPEDARIKTKTEN